MTLAKQHKCDYVGCLYKCNANSDLQKHIKGIHLNIRPFECPKCDSKFHTNGKLQRHIKGIHLDLRGFKCSYDGCLYKCNANSDLQRHIKGIHLDLRGFKCPKCDSKFHTNSNLQRHLNGFHTTPNDGMSRGERAINKFLESMGVDFKFCGNQIYQPIRDFSGYRLKFDFIIQGDEPIFIEYDGKQHFEPVDFFGGIERFEKQQAYDKIKNDYCDDNGFLLLRISYKQFGDIPKILTEFICENTDWGFE